MNGKFEPGGNTDQQCEHCGLWFSDRGIKAHEVHCRFENRPERILPPDTDGGAPTGSGGDPSTDPGDGPDDPSPPDPGAGAAAAPDDNDGDTPATATDGGPGLGLGDPPEPPADPDPTDADGLADRFVEVDQYVAAVREEIGNGAADMLADQLASYDVVDIEGTTEETVVAYGYEEVPGDV